MVIIHDERRGITPEQVERLEEDDAARLEGHRSIRRQKSEKVIATEANERWVLYLGNLLSKHKHAYTHIRVRIYKYLCIGFSRLDFSSAALVLEFIVLAMLESLPCCCGIGIAVSFPFMYLFLL